MTTKKTNHCKNIAFAHDTNVYGGMEVYLTSLLKRIDRSKYNPYVLVPGYQDEWKSSPQQFIDEVKELGIPLIKPADPGNTFGISSFIDIKNTGNALKEAEIEILHIHTRHPTAARKTTLASKLAGVKVLIRTEHLPPSIKYNRFTKYLVKPFDQMTDCIVTDSNQNYEEHLSLIGRNPNKVYRSYCGVELENFNLEYDVRAAKANIGLNPEMPAIGAIGRFHQQKGLKYFVDAASYVLEKTENVQFFLVGDGPLMDEIKEQISNLGLNNKVLLFGFQANYIPYMEAMDIGVMPSLWEGFSISMLEFMALGKPVVFSDHPSFMEAATHREHALIVPREDSKAIGDAILELLKSPELAKELGTAARLRVEQNFTNQRLANDMMNLYSSFS
jgi:glycosyltransferase involved in cell wall biosynthesis